MKYSTNLTEADGAVGFRLDKFDDQDGKPVTGVVQELDERNVPGYASDEHYQMVKMERDTGEWFYRLEQFGPSGWRTIWESPDGEFPVKAVQDAIKVMNL